VLFWLNLWSDKWEDFQSTYDNYITGAAYAKWCFFVRAGDVNEHFRQLLSDHDGLEHAFGGVERSLRWYTDMIGHRDAGWPFYHPRQTWSSAQITRFYRMCMPVSHRFYEINDHEEEEEEEKDEYGWEDEDEESV